MSLRQELAEQKMLSEQRIPLERTVLYKAKIAELRANFIIANALGVGQRVPDFVLPEVKGRQLALSDVLREGPAVITFYRGSWCPYCNLQLRAYQRALPEITALGARLIAISPQTPDESLSTAERNALAYDVLSDAGNAVARAFGLGYKLPPELIASMQASGKSLTDINGDDGWELPVPGTFVVAPDGRVTLASIDVDHRVRLEPDQIIEALREIAGSRRLAAIRQ